MEGQLRVTQNRWKLAFSTFEVVRLRLTRDFILDIVLIPCSWEITFFGLCPAVNGCCKVESFGRIFA